MKLPFRLTYLRLGLAAAIAVPVIGALFFAPKAWSPYAPWASLSAWTSAWNSGTSEPANRAPAGDQATKARTPSNFDACSNLYRTICGGKGATRDPTGIVQPDADGEQEALEIYEKIIREHPDWSRDQVDEELVNQVYTPRRRERMTSAHHWVQRRVIALIQRQPDSVFNTQEKSALIERVKKLELQLPPPASVYSDEPDLYTKSDVFYERTGSGELRLRVGGAYLLTAKSWFNVVFTIAHELGHSIDPCELRIARLSIPALDRVNACFLKSNWVEARTTRSECGANDQLSETFADWLAVRITFEAVREHSPAYSQEQIWNATINSVRDLCEQDDFFPDTGFHPHPKVRIEKILGLNPGIRELLGCTPAISETKYCSLE